MKATLTFDLPQDQDDFNFATKGKDWWHVCWEMDQWLRAQYRYSNDEEFNEDIYNTYGKARNKLQELMIENGVSLDDIR